jgi:hypothetical protein
VGTLVGSAMHRRPRTGMTAGGRDRGNHHRQTSVAGRRFQGLQPARAAGGLKKNYPGKCGAFLQGTPAHFRVQGLRTSRWMCLAPQAGLGFAWVLQGPDASRWKGPPTTRGHGAVVSDRVLRLNRGDKAHGRLEGDRRRLGYVMRGSKAAHVAGERIGSACGLEGSDERIDRGKGFTASCAARLSEGAGGRCGSRPLTAA